MRICILCEDQFVNTVRENENNTNILRIPLSPTGKLPATHWFCTMSMPEDKVQLYLNKMNKTIIEIEKPHIFLEKWNLKIIK